MKVLIVGSGGREHALGWACSRSSLKPQIYCAPGNGGTTQIAENIDNIDAEDLISIIEFVKHKKIDLTIVGPEVPLVDGLADMLKKSKCKVFGPTQKAARIEGSKAFAKRLVDEAGVPTAEFEVFRKITRAEKYLRELCSLPVGAPIAGNKPFVVKASGLAAGKGVRVCSKLEEVIDAARDMLEHGAFGKAGSKIIIEEYLNGIETSLMAFVDGEDYLLLPPSRDHKQAFDNDKGPNTGGMGAFSPLDDLTSEDTARIAEKVFPPILKKFVKQGTPYSGLLYAGLMLTDYSKEDKGVKVLEFNCRFGDPEAQVLLPIIKVDPLEIMLAVAENRLKQWMVDNDLEPHDWQKLTGDRHAVTVVAAASGYPESYPKGMLIENLPSENDDVILFHAGTAIKRGRLVTSGGRALDVTGLGGSHKKAVETVYAAIEQVKFKGVRFRTDIGRKEY
ncbi:phosphoribosylamine--glycine ligase [bacterium]|nr:phosphoribosylamine--glycine ligase [bacterium]